MAKRTPWYPGSVKPVRVGLYEREVWGAYRNDFFVNLSYWNGEFWGGWSNSKRYAIRNKSLPSIVQDAKWRGLARSPSTQSKP